MRPMKKIAVLFSGKGTNFAHLAKTFQGDIEIALAITNNPNAGGIEVAKTHDIPLEIIDSLPFQTREAFDEVLVKAIQKAGVDLVVLAGFMRILTPVFTDNVKAINLHPSLLPRHKGVEAIRRSFEDEYLEGGVSVHWVSGELDGGEIIVQKTISKSGLDFEAYDKIVRRLEKEVLSDAIRVVLS
ncbi:MAG: phosphoribosylglycinamide formyltransferase [Campylobacterales bacterium]|nr:phosphoribosylglycinamide formyltransferase [Campylobacterales bacterium]